MPSNRSRANRLKNYLSIILILIIAYSGHAQRLSGCYKLSFTGIGESDEQYWFSDDGTFRYEAWDDTGDYIGAGEYSFKSDSIVFKFMDVPDWIKTPQLIRSKSVDSLSTITVINPWNNNPSPFTYQVFEGEEMLERGESDAFGRASIKLDAGKKMKIWSGSLETISALNYPFSMEIDADTTSMDYVVLNSGFRNKPESKKAKTVAYPFFMKRRKEESFRIRKHGNWETFTKCNS